MALAGNIDPVSILNQKGPDDVRAAGQACIAAAAQGGGFILTSGCDLPPTIPLENIRAMLEAA
jgi:uroporphyrinogen decarboxylase